MIRILIVDDDMNYRYAVRSLLPWAQHGFEIVGEAVHGRQALELLGQTGVDLVITDISMPQMSGVELVREVRRLHPGIEIIALSGYDDYEYVREALRLGAMDYLLKMDMQPAQMLRAVQEAARRLGRGGPEAHYSPKVRAALEHIRAHYTEPITVQAIADAVEISPNYLSSVFKAETGERIVEAISRMRVQAALPLILEGKLRAYQIADKVGFENATYFSTTFKRVMGVTLQQYQAGQKS